MRTSKHTYGGPWAETKTLYKFDMSSLPPNAIITQATMTLSPCYACTPFYLHYDLGGGSGNAGVVKQVTSPWTEFGVTWNSAPSTTSIGAYTTSNFGNNTSSSLVEPGMASLAQNWLTSPATNFGVELSLADTADYYHGIFFASRETSVAAYRPKLCVEYVVPSSCNQIVCHGGTMNLAIGASGGSPGYNGIGIVSVGAGPFSFTVTDANGCSSTVSGMIYEPPAIETLIKLDTCENYVWPANGMLYTSSGIYSHVFTAANGCDSTVILDLTLHTPPPTTFVGITSCGPYFYPANGIYYLASTQFSYLGGKDNYGCDSVFIVNITIHPQPTIQVIPFAADCATGLGAFALIPSGGTAPYTITVTPCPSMCSYMGLGISTSQIYPIGNYTITVIDANGCSNSTVASIQAPPPHTITYAISVPCGSSYTWPVNNQTYPAPSNNLWLQSSVNGCDTFVNLVITTGCQNTNSLIVNTGYDPVTNLPLIWNNIADPFWTITGIGGSTFTPASTTYTGSSWATDPSCRAVCFAPNDQAIGQRTYRRTFRTCSNDNLTFDLNMAYDNWINGIYIDGILVSSPSTITAPANYSSPVNFNTFHNFHFTKYLTAGTHTLDIQLVNVNMITGLNLFGTIQGVSSSLVSNTSPANCCCNAQTLTSTGTIKIFNQGYYIGNGEMQPVLSNQGIGTSVFATDSVVVELHESIAPYALVSSYRQVITNNGNCDFSFPSSMEGTAYYLVVKHRNALETWSANPVLLTNQINYDFTQASTQAYGANQAEVEPGIFALYSGDINQDGFIDSFDFPLLDTDIFNGVSGVYVNTDLNGDGFVDSFDFTVFDVNSYNGVSVMTP